MNRFYLFKQRCSDLIWSLVLHISVKCCLFQSSGMKRNIQFTPNNLFRMKMKNSVTHRKYNLYILSEENVAMQARYLSLRPQHCKFDYLTNQIWQITRLYNRIHNLSPLKHDNCICAMSKNKKISHCAFDSKNYKPSLTII